MQVSSMISNIADFESKEFSENKVGIEIQTFPQHMLDMNIDEFIFKWKKILEGFDRPISLHGSSFDLNPGSTDQRILEVTKYRYLQSIQIAKEINAKYVIFHSQINPLLSVKRIQQMKVENQIKFWIDLFDKNIPSDMFILLENEYDYSFEEIKQIHDGVNKPNFGICLDIGHVLAYSKFDIEDWIRELRENIKYIHLHWNDKKTDQHNRPTDTELNLLHRLLRKYDISPIITLEYRSKDICKEAKRVRKLISQ